jgi:hypothetical protein
MFWYKAKNQLTTRIRMHLDRSMVVSLVTISHANRSIPTPSTQPGLFSLSVAGGAASSEAAAKNNNKGKESREREAASTKQAKMSLVGLKLYISNLSTQVRLFVRRRFD